jgi:hypothetical protein
MIPCPWDRFAPATVKYRENNLQSWVRQPANTWSNLGYVLVGLWLYLQFRIQAPSVWMGIIPLTAVAIGIASGLYHASYSFVFQVTDLASMYLLSSFLVTSSLKRLAPMSDAMCCLLYLGLFLGSFAGFLLIRRRSGFLIFAAQALVSMVLEVVLWVGGEAASRGGYVVAIGLLAISLVFWIADYTGRFSDPDNHVLQGHAVWHLLSALCLLFLYNHYLQFI